MNTKMLIFVVMTAIAMCMIVPAGAQPTPVLIYGSTFDNESGVVNNPNVRVTNLDTDESGNAVTSSIYNFYQLVLKNSSEVKEGDTLRIIAINESSTDYHIISVTDYPVTATEINDGGMFNFNLTLDEFYLDLTDFPMYDANGSACSSPGDEEHKMCGPATAQMNLNYMWWNNSADPSGPPERYNQSYLYDYGISHNANTSLPYFDARGMWCTIQYLDPSPYWEYGYNFGLESSTDQNHMLKLICHWICYTVGTVGGHKEGHPYHVPGAVPAYGDYTNWMSVRGVHTNKDACPSPWVTPDDLEVYGFWVNDPYPASMGGIGENSYKTAAEWTNTYYKPLNTSDAWDGKYVAILEPPDDDGGDITIMPSRARFSGTITAEATDEELTVDVGGVPLNQLICNRKLVREKENKVVQAAIGGVNDELIPYDPDFAAAFEGTVAGKPMSVKSDAGDYYLVPFGIDSESDGKSVLAVVIVDSEGGKFKEASWVKEPVKYLSVTPQEALKIVYKEMKGKSTVKVLKKDTATGKLKKVDVIDENVDTLGDITYDETEKQRRKACLELVYKGESPYYPVWKITIGDSVFFVDQSGTLTYDSDEPVPTPTPKPTPIPIKYSDTQVLIE